MFLSWHLCHHDGREKKLLHEREPGAEVRGALNDRRTAQLVVPADALGTDADGGARIHPGRSRLKVYAHPQEADPDRDLIFNGLIVSPEGYDDRVTIAAVDQWVRLDHATPAPGAPIGDAQIRSIQDEASLAMWKMISHSNDRAEELQADPRWEDIPGLGIRKGTIADTGIDRTFTIADGRKTADLLQEEINRNRSPDVEIAPLDTRAERDAEGAGEVHAEFNTYWPQQGTDRSDLDQVGAVLLEEGWNCKLRQAPSAVDPPICNRFKAIGQSPRAGWKAPVWVAENRASMRAFGVWEQEEAFDTDDLDRLQRKAESRVRAYSRAANLFDVYPALEIDGTPRGWARTAAGVELTPPDESWQVPPVFLPTLGGYWMGDTIMLRSRRFRFRVDRGQQGPQTDYPARVTGWALREVDDAFNVGAELEVALENEAQAITGYESEIWTGDGGGFDYTFEGEELPGG